MFLNMKTRGGFIRKIGTSYWPIRLLDLNQLCTKCVLCTMAIYTTTKLICVTLGRNSDLLPEAICCCLQTCNVVEIVCSHEAHTDPKYRRIFSVRASCNYQRFARLHKGLINYACVRVCRPSCMWTTFLHKSRSMQPFLPALPASQLCQWPWLLSYLRLVSYSNFARLTILGLLAPS